MKDPHQIKLIEAAQRLGVEVVDLQEAWRIDAVKYRFQDQEALVIDGRCYPGLSLTTDQIVEDKYASKQIMRGLGIPVPAECVFEVVENEEDAPDDEIGSQVEAFMEAGKIYVCKPLYGTDGDGVGMHLSELYAIEDHVNAWRDQYASWILEEQVEGADLRIQAIGGKLVAGCVREPAFVTGNGENSLDELIEQHNEKIAAQNPKNRLEIDAPTRILLKQQNVFLSSVIESGRKIVLKQVSNMGQGGVARDVTDSLHPSYHDWIAKVSHELNLGTFALDAISTDCTADPATHARVIELNAKAQWMHHTFSEVRQHDIPALILRDLLGI